MAQLAVTLQWTPEDLIGPCYYVAPDSAMNQECGWTSNHPPNGAFNGDSSYKWTLEFPPGSDHSCATFWIWGEHCDDIPANFCLSSVMTIDSQGRIDTLLSSGGASLLGGVGVCEANVDSLLPHDLAQGFTQQIAIIGRQLTGTTWVTLTAEGSAGSLRQRIHPASTQTEPLLGAEVTVVSDSLVTAMVSIPAGFQGVLDLAAGNPTRQTHSLLAATAVDGQAAFSQTTTGGTSCSPGVTGMNLIEDSSCGGSELYAMPLCPSTLYPVQGERQNIMLYSCGIKLGEDYAGMPVHVAFTPVSATGGHCHDDTNRPSFYAYPFDGSQLREFDTIVSSAGDLPGAGWVEFNAVAPEVCGDIRCTVWSTDYPAHYNPQHQLTTQYMIETPGLINMTAQPGNTLSFDGSRPLPISTYHPNDRWMVPSFYTGLNRMNAELDALLVKNIALPSAWSAYSLCKQFTVGDASLQFGGALDYSNNWFCSQGWHRGGASVDLVVNAFSFAAVMSYCRISNVLYHSGMQQVWWHVDAANRRVVHLEWQP